MKVKPKTRERESSVPKFSADLMHSKSGSSSPEELTLWKAFDGTTDNVSFTLGTTTRWLGALILLLLI